ncbi:LuxR C-terminal-related transcriptional regulator [Actinoplanes sp. NPDC024001]|uniref:LuxR C-terminal-related transcriptional regulator n=1 Tax=Actinoplanes sp. NPDC024001 TaxID=3154598 RepID=UPI0033D04418
MGAATSGRIAAEIVEIATMHGSLEQRAQALLEPLSSLLQCDAAWISLFDSDRHCQRTVAFRGYPERLRRHLNGAPFMAELELVGMDRARSPIRVKDCPVPVAELEVWAEYLQPAGFNEGVSLPLATTDGRYLGMLGSHTEAGVPASDETCDELERLGPLIAHAVDAMRTVSALTSLVGGAVAGIMLTRAGRVETLPGLPGDPLLAPGSPALSVVAAALTGPRTQVTFLVPRDDVDDSLARVTALTCPPQPPGHHRAVVLLSPPPDLHGLTRRELQVLGLLVDGCTNAAIAAALHISPRTTVGHIEHVMIKLGAASRTIAALRAEREGLYIPAGITLGPAGRR